VLCVTRLAWSPLVSFSILSCSFDPRIAFFSLLPVLASAYPPFISENLSLVFSSPTRYNAPAVLFFCSCGFRPPFFLTFKRTSLLMTLSRVPLRRSSWRQIFSSHSLSVGCPKFRASVLTSLLDPPAKWLFSNHAPNLFETGLGYR